MRSVVIPFRPLPCRANRRTWGSMAATAGVFPLPFPLADAGRVPPSTCPAPIPAPAIDAIVQQWLAELSHHAAQPAPAGGPEDLTMQPNEQIELPTDAAGESWPDVIRHYGKRYGSTPEQIAQGIDRAQALVAHGTSPASAIETVRRTLARWSEIRADDATFAQRRAVLARNTRLWVQPA